MVSSPISLDLQFSGSLFESKALAHYSCYLRPPW